MKLYRLAILLSRIPCTGEKFHNCHTVEAQEIAFYYFNEIELGGQSSTSTTCLGSEASPIHGQGTPSSFSYLVSPIHFPIQQCVLCQLKGDSSIQFVTSK